MQSTRPLKPLTWEYDASSQLTAWTKTHGSPKKFCIDMENLDDIPKQIIES